MKRVTHQMISAKGMMKPGVNGARINQLRHCHLMNSSQSLIKRMGNNLINQLVVYCNKTINRIINYFSKWHSFDLLKSIRTGATIIFGEGIIYICNNYK